MSTITTATARPLSYAEYLAGGQRSIAEMNTWVTQWAPAGTSATFSHVEGGNVILTVELNEPNTNIVEETMSLLNELEAHQMHPAIRFVRNTATGPGLANSGLKITVETSKAIYWSESVMAELRQAIMQIASFES